MTMALCTQAESQAPQHFRSSEELATCDGCFARQSMCSVISLHSTDTVIITVVFTSPSEAVDVVVVVVSNQNGGS